MTSMGGLRESILPSHDLAGTPLRLAHRTTLLAATISRRRRVRSPMRDVRPRRSLPPVDLCTGVRPTQAAKSRPDRNVSGVGASASMAVAINSPIPGTVISGDVVGLRSGGDLAVEFDDLDLQASE